MSRNVKRKSQDPVIPVDPPQQSLDEQNLYIVHDPAMFGPPYGIFSGCDSRLLDDCADKGVEVLVMIPSKGYLVQALRSQLNYSKIPDSGWYNTRIELVFHILATLMHADINTKKCVQFASLDFDS